MDQPIPVQEAQCRRDGRAQPDAFADGQTLAPPAIVGKSPRHVLFRNDDLAGVDVIAEFHHVIKIAGGIVASHLENIHQAIVQPRDRFKFEHAIELTLKSTALFECARMHSLDRAVRPQNIPGQPHLATAATPDDPEEFVVGHDGRDRWRDRRRRFFTGRIERLGHDGGFGFIIRRDPIVPPTGALPF